MSDVLNKIKHAKRQNAQNLDLSNMNIETLPDEFYQLKSVLFVNLANNKLRTLGREIENLVNLREINLEFNLIDTLPNEVLNLANLSTVKLQDNPIFPKLREFKFNWKESLKEFLSREARAELQKNDSGPSTEIKRPSTTKLNLKPFDNKVLFGNIAATTSTGFLKRNSRGEPGVIGEIPRCHLFSQSGDGGGTKLKLKNFNKIKMTNTSKDTLSKDNQLEHKSKDEEYAFDEKLSEEEIDKEVIKVDQLNLIAENNNFEGLKKEFQLREKEYKETINQLEKEIKDLKEANQKLLTSQQVTEPVKINNTIINKRNWMEDVNEIKINSSSTNIVHGNTHLDESKFKELELQLQKETINNKRMKTEIEKLTQQLAISKVSMNTEGVMKYVKEISYDEIVLGDKIGQGGFSMIYKGTWNFISVAVKVIFDPNVTEELLSEFNNEIKMLFMLRHPNIVSILGISTKPQKLTIVSEYVPNGSLFEYLHRTRHEINLDTKLKIVRQIVYAFVYIHKSGIVHRDLKTHNILLDTSLNVKLCDFGLAKHISDLSWGSGGFAGTPSYMAPELFQRKAYDEKIDVFAFGTVLWEILVRKIPYEGQDAFEIKGKVVNGENLFTPKTVPSDLAGMIDKCRAVDPMKRPSFEELAKLI